LQSSRWCKCILFRDRIGPGPLGDAGTVAAAAAAANTMLDATGKHSRQVVLNPDSFKAII